MFNGQPNSSEILCNTRTTSGTLVTVPAGKWYTGDLTISASVSTAGNSTPTVAVNGTDAAPAAGTTIGRVNVSGLALTTVVDSASFGVIVLAPSGNDVTIDFTAGASGTSSASINGFIFG